MAESILASALRGHGISIDGNALRAALSDPADGTSMSSWATMHLNSDTLLSVEELDLWVVSS